MAEKNRKNVAAASGAHYREGLGERIAAVANMVGGKRALAQRLGIHESMLYRYIKGENALSAALLVAVAEVGGVPLDWLATGAAASRSVMLHETGAPAYRPSRPDTEAYRPVPFCSRTAGAPLAFDADWLSRMWGASGEALCLIEVQGESMEPTLRAGDLVLIDRRVKRIAEDGLYALRHANGAELKRVQKLPGGRIALSSDHPGHQGITLSRAAAVKQLRILGRVLWYGRRV